MWIFTPHGFVSAVKDNQRPGHMLLRFRCPKQGRAIIKLAIPDGARPRLRETPPPADYRWKASVTHRVFQQLLMAAAGEAMGYINFKGACSGRREWDGEKHVLHDVWATMEAMQRRKAPAPTSREYPGEDLDQMAQDRTDWGGPQWRGSELPGLEGEDKMHETFSP